MKYIKQIPGWLIFLVIVCAFDLGVIVWMDNKYRDNSEYINRKGQPMVSDNNLLKIVEVSLMVKIKTCEDFRKFKKEFPDFIIPDRVVKQFDCK